LVKALGIDCAGRACSAGVVADGLALSSQCRIVERGQAEALVPMIDAVMTEARLGLAALDFIAVTIGPGSFTGIRTGLATARGLALASGLPLIGITSFAAIADAVAENRQGLPLVVALESKRAELFLQRFDQAGESQPALIAFGGWESFAPTGEFALAGDGAARFARGLKRSDFCLVQAYAHSSAVAAARLGAPLWESGVLPLPPTPLYLRAPDVTLQQPPHREQAP
jgi:tRNA threonylcarbamoyladenosine biosynthesis protein TsaB